MKFLASVALVLATACSSQPSLFIQRPKSPTIDQDVTTMWAGELRTTARNGDWLLTRAYYAMSDLIVIGTAGEALSHASMYDADRRMVIEAVSSGVREIPIDEFLSRNHYVIVVRPSNTSVEDGNAALARARSKIGTPFDMTGMFGFDNPKHFYCSELVFWASQTEARTGRSERVVTPANLMKYGEVVYWSGKRDDPQIMDLAASRARTHTARR